VFDAAGGKMTTTSGVVRPDEVDEEPEGQGAEVTQAAGVAKDAQGAGVIEGAGVAEDAEGAGVIEGAGVAEDAEGAGSEEDEDVQAGGFGRRTIVWTTLVCVLFAGGGHGALWFGAAQRYTLPIFWGPVVGISISVVAIVAFGGFFLAPRRARIAIAASFMVTFFVILSYVLTISGLQDTLNGQRDGLNPSTVNVAKELIGDFRWIVITIIAFYFGTEGAVSIAKVMGVSRTAGADPAAIRSADGDLPLVPSRRQPTRR